MEVQVSGIRGWVKGNVGNWHAWIELGEEYPIWYNKHCKLLSSPSRNIYECKGGR